MNKILIVGPSWVGDMVMAQSLFKLLKLSDVQIDVLAPAWTFPLLKCMPEVSSAISLPFGHAQFELGKRFQFGKKLRKEKYTQAIILPNSFKSALIPFFANIPKRTGWVGECRYFLLNDARRLNKKKYPLMIERFMALGMKSEATLPSEYPTPALSVSSESQLHTLSRYSLTLSDQRVLAICPGAEFGSAKRWPEHYFAEVASKKIREGWSVWILGSKNDVQCAEKIESLVQKGCVNFAGKTTLEEAINLISLCQGVVTNDSGLMHVAAALQKPVVALYGPTTPDFTPPLHTEAKVVKLNVECQPCFKRECPLQHHRCMRELTPQMVLDVLAEWDK